MKGLVLTSALVSFAASAAPKAHQLTKDYGFESFMADFDKQYFSPTELAQREARFLATRAHVMQHNANPASGYRKGINKFADMTDEEIAMYKGKHGGFAGPFVEPPAKFMASLKPVSDLPDSVDWRQKGAVTAVKDQGGCGSCWAFSATEVLESHIAVNTGKLLELSPQQMVSCAPNPDDCGGTGGCQGSVQWLGFNYTQGAGLSLEKDYPYQGITGICREKKIKPAGGNTGFVRLPANNYTVLMNAVATLGPVAISVDASWSFYEGGVYSGDCGTTIDHAVVLDGYGTEDGKKYYLVRNSWGSSWGDGGYIKIERHDDDSTNCGVDKDPSTGTECKPYPKTQTVCGLCGILSDSSYPDGAFAY